MHAPLIFVGGKLTTQRMLLEALTPSHAPLMIEGFADVSLYRWIDVGPPTDADELERRFRRIANPYAPSGELWLNWAMLLRETGRYVGLIEATVRPDRVVHLAYYVFTAYMRQGSRAKRARRSSITCGMPTTRRKSAPIRIFATFRRAVCWSRWDSPAGRIRGPRACTACLRSTIATD